MPRLVQAQQAGLAFHVGTTGLGADLSVLVAPRVAIRAGASVFPFDLSITASDVEYTISPPSPQFLAVLDLSPGGAFRVSAGMLIASRDFEIDAKLTQPVEIGGTFYRPDQIGSLTGTFDTRGVSPYLGIGFGMPARSRVSFFLDLGVAFHGTPRVSASADGPVASLPQFQQDLDREVENIQNDVDPFKVFPIVSVGVVVGLGR